MPTDVESRTSFSQSELLLIAKSAHSLSEMLGRVDEWLGRLNLVTVTTIPETVVRKS